MFSISTDEEQYYGSYETAEKAIEEAANGYAYTNFWIGECVSPTQPEDMWDSEDWLEHVSCQDAYSGDYAEGWDNSTKEQRAELEQEVKTVMAAWLDRHKLRPSFFVIENPVEYHVVDGIPCKS